MHELRYIQYRTQPEGARVQAESGLHTVLIYDHIGKLIGERLSSDNALKTNYSMDTPGYPGGGCATQMKH
jgi:hypothetical protein